MNLHPAERRRSTAGDAALCRRFVETRGATAQLAEGLSDADATVQSMRDASPVKWHLGHTTWYFEAFVLSSHDPGYRAFDPRYAFLFNSYYETLGPRHPRPQRGMLTRPDLDRVRQYRQHVENAVTSLLSRLGEAPPEKAQAVRALIELGVQHEQQHQELLLTDLLHLFSLNPLAPVYRDAPGGAGGVCVADAAPARFVAFPGARVAIGHDSAGFSYDCEAPAHEVLLQPFAIANRPVTNGEWLAFVNDGGYREPLLWLSDGWDRVREERWEAPLYWRRDGNDWTTMTLHGERDLDVLAPVAHVSYFEADAFARWAGKRLPTEFEWEACARSSLRRAAPAALVAPAGSGGDELAQAPVVEGHFADDRWYVPLPAAASGSDDLQQMFGDVWEWTSSAFAPYPGFRPAPGAAGEYNGKFMCGQYVLRGGSCATPRGHVRATYRNFFPPPARWQFAGVRLAEDRS
ncbi:MAG: ergothioneine biosynthesis protein EgtB [Burkholderiaceae bacterium]|nr:ergothioneine biosynthesis protein EgtB [Burkholderiaceae bacterium]